MRETKYLNPPREIDHLEKKHNSDRDATYGISVSEEENQLQRSWKEENIFKI